MPLRILSAFKYFVVLAGILIGLAMASVPAQAGYAHFLYDAQSGAVLASENADTLNHPASLTKMMTLYMTFEALKAGRLRWEQQIVMTPNAASKIPSKLGIRAGQTLTVREAVLGMAIRSANDAAAAMGDHLGGSEANFGIAMTARARALGMKNSVFRNASGLPDPAQVTTARDMAILALALIRDFPREYALFSERSFSFRGSSLRGHNNLMYRYPGMDGIKTGFTNASGYNIASAVNVNGRRVIGVMLGGKTARIRDDQMAALLDRNLGVSTGTAIASASGRSTITLLPRAELSSQAGMAIASAASLPPVETRSASVAATSERVSSELWRIQIGRSGDRQTASGILSQAMPLLSQRFGSASPSVESVAGESGEFFRSRFAGFTSRQAANDACAILKESGMSCFVVQ